MDTQTVSKHQKFQMAPMLRSAIKEHPQNPRIIGESARKKLKSKMKEVGLIQPLIVNKTTGYLLGGHQRLASLDSLERYKPGVNDYMIDVAIVELDQKAELEMLVFLNNPSSMGAWDLDGLANIAGSDFAITLDGMGFDRVDAETLFEGDARFGGLFGDDPTTAQIKGTLKELKTEGSEAEDNKGKSGLDVFREKGGKDQNPDYYVVIVFKSPDEKAEFMAHVGAAKNEQFIVPDNIMAMEH